MIDRGDARHCECARNGLARGGWRTHRRGSERSKSQPGRGGEEAAPWGSCCAAALKPFSADQLLPPAAEELLGTAGLTIGFPFLAFFVRRRVRACFFLGGSAADGAVCGRFAIACAGGATATAAAATGYVGKPPAAMIGFGGSAGASVGARGCIGAAAGAGAGPEAGASAAVRVSTGRRAPAPAAARVAEAAAMAAAKACPPPTGGGTAGAAPAGVAGAAGPAAALTGRLIGTDSFAIAGRGGRPVPLATGTGGDDPPPDAAAGAA